METSENRVGSKRREGEREKERDRLAGGETEHWRDLEMAWVGNGHQRKGTPENFKQIK